MGPDIVLVPELVSTPLELLAIVYVFTNGVGGNCPFGFQLDVLESVPVDENYRSLRAGNLNMRSRSVRRVSCHPIGYRRQ